MGASFTYAQIIVITGDPLAISQPVHSANAAEVSALAAVFQSAADSAGGTIELSQTAAQLAQQAAVVTDATAFDLLAEVQNATKVLGLGHDALVKTAVTLNEVAAKIAQVQQQLQQIELLAQTTAANTATACDAALTGVTDPVAANDIRTTYFNQAADEVNGCIGQIKDAVNSYEAFLTDRLASLHDGVGYVPPGALSDGEMLAPAMGGGGEYTPDFPPVSADAGSVATWWNQKSAAEQAVFIDLYGNGLKLLHGLPSRVYDLLNRRMVTDDLITAKVEMDQAQKVADDLVAKYYPKNSLDIRVESGMGATNGLNDAFAVLAAAQAKFCGAYEVADSLSPFATGGTYLLEYSAPTCGSLANGQAVVAYGNPDNADNLSIEIPGVTNQSSDMPDLVANAAKLKNAMDRKSAPGDTNAVIAYMGYDAPDSLTEGASQKWAKDAAIEMAADFKGYVAANTAADGAVPNLVVFGHSYGSYTASMALADDIPGGAPYAAKFVALGSPGLYVDDVVSLNVGAAYFMTNEGDPIPHLAFALGSTPIDGVTGIAQLPGDAPSNPLHVHGYFGDDVDVNLLATVATA